jgi:hypothetical protein
MTLTLTHTITGYKPKNRKDAIRFFYEELAKHTTRRSHPSKWTTVVRVSGDYSKIYYKVKGKVKK